MIKNDYKNPKNVENLNDFQKEHKYACIGHAMLRAKERYGIKLKQGDILNIVDLILEQNAGFVSRINSFKTVWDVGYKKVLFRTVYNKKLGTVQTFLSKGMKCEGPNEYIEMEEKINKLGNYFPELKI